MLRPKLHRFNSTTTQRPNVGQISKYLTPSKIRGGVIELSESERRF